LWSAPGYAVRCLLTVGKSFLASGVEVLQPPLSFRPFAAAPTSALHLWTVCWTWEPHTRFASELLSAEARPFVRFHCLKGPSMPRCFAFLQDPLEWQALHCAASRSPVIGVWKIFQTRREFHPREITRLPFFSK
jgi:hypothetical protein